MISRRIVAAKTTVTLESNSGRKHREEDSNRNHSHHAPAKLVKNATLKVYPGFPPRHVYHRGGHD